MLQTPYLFGCSDDLLIDALSRDFTINAVYVDVINHRVAYPFDNMPTKDSLLKPITKDVPEALLPAPLSGGIMPSVMLQDCGGQFRLFKELSKSNPLGLFQVSVGADDWRHIVRRLRTTVDALLQFESDDETRQDNSTVPSVNNNNNNNNNDDDNNNSFEIVYAHALRWLRKMAVKLFGSDYNIATVHDRLRSIRSRLALLNHSTCEQLRHVTQKIASSSPALNRMVLSAAMFAGERHWMIISAVEPLRTHGGCVDGTRRVANAMAFLATGCRPIFVKTPQLDNAMKTITRLDPGIYTVGLQGLASMRTKMSCLTEFTFVDFKSTESDLENLGMRLLNTGIKRYII